MSLCQHIFTKLIPMLFERNELYCDGVASARICSDSLRFTLMLFCGYDVNVIPWVMADVSALPPVRLCCLTTQYTSV